MCLLVFAWKMSEDFPLVVSANRDEFYARPTQAAHFWPDHQHIFAGRDLQGGGSWMGISSVGRFAAVTNIRDPSSFREDAKSRGALVSDFLLSNMNAQYFCQGMQAALYNGFNFLGFDGETLVYQSSAIDKAQVLSRGVYALSNATLNTPWPKTTSALNKLKQWMIHPASVQDLALLLNDTSIVADECLPETGVSLELERALSAEFITLPEYGTRCSTGLMVEKSGRAEYCEITHGTDGGMQQQVIEKFIKTV